MFRLELWLKMRFIVISMVTWSGILVKLVVNFVRNKEFSGKICILNLRTKEKVYLQE